MSRTKSGFTIVELLIVIVVIGILAAIAIVGYSGIQKRAHNSARITEFNGWIKHFEIYRATNSQLPSMPNGNYCLGTGFPNQTCRNWDETGTTSYPEVASAPLLAQLESVGTFPGSMRTPVNTHIGPYVTYTSTDVTFVLFINENSGNCPANTTQVWFGSGDTLMCQTTIKK